MSKFESLWKAFTSAVARGSVGALVAALLGISGFAFAATSFHSHGNMSANQPTTSVTQSSVTSSSSSTTSNSTTTSGQTVGTLPPCPAGVNNHGQYVSSVAHMHLGGQITSQAAQSNCGKPASSKSSTEDNNSTENESTDNSCSSSSSTTSVAPSSSQNEQDCSDNNSTDGQSSSSTSSTGDTGSQSDSGGHDHGNGGDN
jgi:hypothetical protein